MDEKKNNPVSIPTITLMTRSLFEKFGNGLKEEQEKYPDTTDVHLHFDNAVMNLATHLAGTAVARILVISGNIPQNNFDKISSEVESAVKKSLEGIFREHMKGDYCILDVPPFTGEAREE